MSLSKLTENLNIISNLPDKPTETSEELKAKFDEAVNIIKEYINSELTTEIDQLIAQLQSGKIDTSKIINDLTTGGAGNVASAEMVKNLNTGKANSSHTHNKAEINDFDHNHDDRYYTESEIDTKLGGKANSSHTHTTSQISGLKSGATTKFSYGTGTPSGGDNGDVYIQYFT